MTARSDETPIDVKLQELALHIHEEAWPAADGTLTSLRNEWKRRRVWFMLNKNIERISSSDRILAQFKARGRLERWSDGIRAFGRAHPGLERAQELGVSLRRRAVGSSLAGP